MLAQKHVIGEGWGCLATAMIGRILGLNESIHTNVPGGF